MTPPPPVRSVLTGMARHPWRRLILRWNWKAAVTSALARGAIFFSTNLGAGLDAATAAMLAEGAFRLSTAGFYGAMVESLRRAQPAWQATLAALVLPPMLSHSGEWLLHWWRGTPYLALSLAASATFTLWATAFNLYAMRRGVLIGGEGRRSLRSDFAVLPGILGHFIADGARAAGRGLRWLLASLLARIRRRCSSFI